MWNERRAIAIVAQHLPGGDRVYSVYWHVSHLQVAPGQPVERGQAVALVCDQGLNSHLH